MAPHASGGTLASAAAGSPTGVDPVSPVVVLAQNALALGETLPLALGETLPSKDLPVISRSADARRGVAPLVVVFLVLGALAAGLLLGWALGRAA
jgi:hypothetical protein